MYIADSWLFLFLPIAEDLMHSRDFPPEHYHALT